MNMLTRHEQKNLVADLMQIPGRIKTLSEAFDLIDQQFQAQITALTIKAYTEPLFPPKKDGDPLRIASNDDERKLAVALMCQTDAEYQRLLALRDDAQRKLAYERNKLEAARIVVKLFGESERN